MKILSIGLLACASLMGLWAATKSVASHLHFALDLGPPLLRLGDTNVYAPWAWLIGNRTFATRVPAVFGRAASITTVGATVGCALAALCARMRTKTSAASHAHGSSRRATTDELGRAGLLGPEGVVLGQTTEATFRTTLDARGAPVHRIRRRPPREAPQWSLRLERAQRPPAAGQDCGGRPPHRDPGGPLQGPGDAHGVRAARGR